MKKKEIKKYLKKIHHFIFKSDSTLSLIVNIILIYILLKFIVFPLISLILGTQMPIVAIMSGSMEHKFVPIKINNTKVWEMCGNIENKKIKISNYNDFWTYCKDNYKKFNITEDDFEKFPYKNGFNTGDVMIVKGTTPENIKIGDVIIFYSPDAKKSIIHRVVEKKEINNKHYISTMGDHNREQINSTIKEINIPEEQIIGKAIFRIPYIGWIKVLLSNIF